jgi:hypothetical protein
MKNVTITVDETALAWARIEAAKRNTSVSRLVGEMLAQKMRRSDAYAHAKSAALAFEPIAFVGQYLNRDEIYAERLNRFR